ncbi:hypothetical protein CLV28_1617 [Sediminihabitans luteus]|uniref:DUF5808 domain-containing protein n=1 Tax=Sediminihabitans luteus TaxID=1138585 RepID=A0A2M9CQK7_9CELL|nr:DUF5808 domain-containing protein [Sediminihabitans luteus]PJJ74128.1 hypothetical protein CLV28_1617 [Sediminihabitans luteus]GII97956.1 hypothetical protein Slu03_03340 [Sediminihabitans luteus]
MGSNRTHRNGGGLRGVVQLVVLGLGVAAVVKELRTPPAERTWNGTVAGFVPYDFRFPTLARFRERVWDPDGSHLLSPHVFGVGWTVNVGRVVHLVQEKVDTATE